MTTPSTSSTLDDLKDIFASRRTSLYLLGVVVTTLIGVELCSRVSGLSNTQLLTILEVFVFILLIGWVVLAAHTLSNIDKVGETVLFIFIPSIFMVPIGGMFLQLFAKYHEAAFWLSLAVWTVVGVFRALDEAEAYRSSGFLVGAAAAWSVSGIIISAGTTSFLPYSRSAIEGLNSVHSLLDLRYLLGAIFLGLLIAIASTRAFRAPLPVISDIEAWELEELAEDNWVTWLVRPFISIINIFILLLFVIINYLYKAARITAFYFYAVGRNIAELVIELLRIKRIWISILEVVTIFLALVLGTVFITNACPFILDYARSDAWGIQALDFIFITGFVSLVLLCLGLAFWVIAEYCNDFVEPLIASFAAIISIAFVAGLLLYMLARLDFLYIGGFRVFGPFSALIVLFIVGGVGRVILKSISKKTYGAGAASNVKHDLRVRRR